MILQKKFNEYRLTTSIGIAILAIVLYAFYTYFGTLNKRQDQINLNYDGVKELNYLVELTFLARDREDIEYLSKIISDQKSISEEKRDGDRAIARTIEELKDRKLLEVYRKIAQTIQHENIPQNRKDIYEEFISNLASAIVDTADKYRLFSEQEKNTYFLVSTLVNEITEISEIIGNLRKIDGSEAINSGFKNDLSFVNINRDRLFKIKGILDNYLYKLDIRYRNKLVSTYNEIDTVLKRVDKNLNLILSKEFKKENYYNHYLELSKTLQIFKSYSFIIVNTLLDEFKEKEREIELEKKELILVFSILVIAIIFTLFQMIRKLIKIEKDERVQLKQNQFLKEFDEKISKIRSSQEMAREGIALVAKKFGSINALLYLYNKRNNKFFLGSTYGILPSDIEVKNVLEKNEGLIGETTDFIDIRKVSKVISAGLINAEAKFLITAPLKYTHQLIGIIQFSLFNRDDLTNSEKQLLEEALNILSIYLFKAQNEEETARYLKLVDNFVITSSTNVDGIITSVSDAFVQISGYSKHELIGHNHNIIRHDDMPEELFENMWDTILLGDVWQGEIKNKRKDNSFYWVQVTISPDFDFFKNIIGFTAIRQDISDKKKIEEISIKDGLTNLYNRRHFDDMFHRQINVGKRNKKLLAFMIMDIDFFKKYNDTYGHQEGDVALQKVALILQKSFNRSDDYVFRLGGEEFASIFFIETVATARHLADKFRQRVENLKIPHQHSDTGFVTVSIGLYIKELFDDNSVDEIYKKADKALYLAKNGGRNRVVLANQQQID